MKKTQKCQLDELLKLMEQMHGEIEKFILKKQNQDAVSALEDCQSAAISIGQMIDSIEGEDTATVGLLEEYCEVVYSIHEDIISKNPINASRIRKLLNKKQQKITTSFNHEFKVIKEAIFLPYKASMWDSLESVWRKYDEDPDWDAKVVPIPYYDRNPDGSMREFHYEGELYPKDVPVIHYKSIDLEKYHPDAIYIHNPYDDANFVTSVHPFYYSKNLKNYTEHLVYIPYFVLKEPNIRNEKSIEAMSHFATTPGVFNADEVIVQSENMRKCYIKALVKATGEHTRGYWEKKIKGTGSPKIDKVKRIKKEDIELPEEWKVKIYKDDGSAKKVILYNTSVATLLRESDEMIEKIKDIFRFFREEQDEIILLWRPHPLIKATISSMRPMLWDTYNRVVEKYVADGFGIYDDSADLNRAIAIADAYYGDTSSVVQLCQSVGMPVMIQNVKVRMQNTRKCTQNQLSG